MDFRALGAAARASVAARDGRATERAPAASSPASAEAPAIDLAHLARQSDNDLALAEELLRLFDRQSAAMLRQLAEGAATRSRRADVAHSLRGSALAVGAWAAARAAQALEAALGRENGEESEIDEALATLAEAIGEARAAIARLGG